jgi:hypothetical protein
MRSNPLSAVGGDGHCIMQKTEQHAEFEHESVNDIGRSRRRHVACATARVLILQYQNVRPGATEVLQQVGKLPERGMGEPGLFLSTSGR